MSVSSVNAEFVKCWPPFAEEIAVRIREALAGAKGALRPYVEVRLEAAPEFTKIPDPLKGGEIEIALPGRGAWGIVFSGMVKAPNVAGFGHRAFRLEARNLRIVAGVALSPPDDGVRPRISGPDALSVAITGEIDVWVQGLGNVLTVKLEPKAGNLVDLKQTLDLGGGIKVPFELSVSKIAPDGKAKAALRIAGLSLAVPLKLPLGPLAALSGGLPGAWPPKGVVQPETPKTGEKTLDEAALQALVKGRRAQVEKSHQNEGVLSDRFVNPLAGKGFVGICGDEDSAIWTGHLLAADALNDDAARLATTLTGVERLFDVPARFAATSHPLPDDPRIKALFPRDLIETDGIFARCVVPKADADKVYKPFDAPASAKKGHWVQEDVPPGAETPRIPWTDAAYYTDKDAPANEPDRAHGKDDHPPTRDSTMGLVLGLACTLRYASDPALRTRAARVAVRLAQRLDRNGWAIVAPRGTIERGSSVRRPGTTRDSLAFYWTMQLATIRIAATADPARFEGRYKALAKAYADHLWLSPWIDSLDPLGAYYPLNLQHAAYAALLILETDPALRKKYLAVGKVLAAATNHHGNPHYDLLRLLAEDDKTALGKKPSPAYAGAATLEAGILWAVSEAAARAEGDDLPLQANPKDQAYLLDRRNDAKYFDKKTLRPYFSVPPSRRRGTHLDFAWQRSPFEPLAPGAEPFGKGRPSVTSPGLDLLLPLAALGRLKDGVAAPPVAAPTPPPSPPPIVLAARPVVAVYTLDRLGDCVQTILDFMDKLGRLGASPKPSEFLNQRLKDLTQGPNGPKRLADFFKDYKESAVAANETGVLLADAVFLISGDPRPAEARLLQAFRPTLRDAWGTAGGLFGVAPNDPKLNERDAEILGAPTGRVLPGGMAAALAESLDASGVLAPLGPPKRPYFDDPDLAFDRALRRLLHVEAPR